MSALPILLSVVLIAGGVGCGRQSADSTPRPATLPQISGTLAVEGLVAPVRVVRDRWGVPHITAENQDDLFFAQGFVQAQDRLFQMDLWRRSVQGRLAEVLGGNFVERDAMTRRFQFRGDMEAEWASYGADTKAIASAFTRGINARVSRARDEWPPEFVLAGWQPEFWRPEDLLNRTDAFVASGNASEEVLRARLTAVVGPDRALALLPIDSASPPPAAPRGLDLAAIDSVVGDALRRVGTPPFFMGFAAAAGSNAWAVARGDSGAPLLATDPHRPLENPSPRYLVHLEAPGWRVAGATSPWLPGVAIGHNDRVAWSMTASAQDTQDLYVEAINPANPRQVREGGRWVDLLSVKDVIPVKGRAEPLPLEFDYTPRGPVIAIDPDRRLVYLLRWSGAEPGGAPELGALAIDRAQSASALRAALTRWKMPAAEFVYADVTGSIGRQVAALTPVRGPWAGALPAPGEAPEHDWRGWIRLDELPGVSDPPTGLVVSANGNAARLGRITDVLSAPESRSSEGFQRLQQDVLAWNAERLVPLLARVRSDRAEVEAVRQDLLGWDRRMSADSHEAVAYASWERELMRRLAMRRLPTDLVDEYVRRRPQVLVPALTEPSRDWFDGELEVSRDALLIDALAAVAVQARASGSSESPAWGRGHAVTFAHPLGIGEGPARRFNIGPFPAGGDADTVLAIAVSASGRSVGPSFRAIFDLGDWDRSLAMNAPGQSESPGSPHFGDLADGWARGEYFPLAFSESAVLANAHHTLMLVPR
jgi:penicillin amidase